MDFSFTPEQETFRQEARGFLKKELRDRPEGGLDAWCFYRSFSKKLAERGWLTMAWPEEWGGQGASHIKQLVYNEEVALHDAPVIDLAMGFYGPHVLVNDGRCHGVEVLPPDINRSGANCTIEGEAVRIGLRYVKGLSETTAREVEEEQERGGEFRSLFDFLERTRLKREAVENLIACGAFDSFGLERRELLWQLGLLYRSEGRNGHDRQLALPLPTEQDMVALPPMTDWDHVAADYAVLDLSPNHHPMAFLRPRLHEGVVLSRMLESLPDGAPVEVAGLVVCHQRPGTAKGFVFLVLEDEFGLVNVIVKPDHYERDRSLVRTEPFVIVRGELQRRDGAANIIADRFTLLRPDGALAPEAHNFG